MSSLTKMAAICSTVADKTSWARFPLEIRCIILKLLLHDGCSLASFATVSREWQATIERHNFARLKLIPSCLADFEPMVRRNQALVGYLWLCLELEEYDCTTCADLDNHLWRFGTANNALVSKAIQDLFSALSTWEPNGDLWLDISVHSPSDSRHFFKYLTFEPDMPSNDVGRHLGAEQVTLTGINDQQHGWIAGRSESVPDWRAIEKLFRVVMDVGPQHTDEEELRWWQQLPLVPAVTGVLLRQQNRRRWKPNRLGEMFARLPRLQEVHYEPWREWDDWQERWTDRVGNILLFESLASRNLRSLVVFENFHQQYPSRYRNGKPTRTANPIICRAIAKGSLNHVHLSASFMVDASLYFQACESSWTWPNLTSLVLTSKLLTPYRSPAAIDDLLQTAAAVAMQMPKLETMEIWNGRKGLAMLFRYQSIGSAPSAIVTWRGTWAFDLRPPVMRAWEAVAIKHGGGPSLMVKEELLGVIGTDIVSHGDAIHHLELSKPVIRPISLQQIRREHSFLGGDT